MNWQETLAELVGLSGLHARFLNMISMMEYIGARKIMKSQDEKRIHPEMLAHMVEEIRHAQLFKKLALKLDSRLITYSDDHMVAGNQGRAYMQDIDRGVESLIGPGDSWTNYLMTTLIVEERANNVYPVYAEILKPFGMDGPLRTIIREEEHHLNEISEALKKSDALSEEKMSVLRAVENQAFMAIIEELKKAVIEEKSRSPVEYHH